MLHDGFRHADGFSFSFVLIQKKRKRKEKIKATSPDLLRKGRSGAEKWTRFVALRSDSIFQRRPSIPPLTPIRLGQSFFHAKALRCWLLAFWFYNATVLRPHLFTSLLDLMAPSFLCSFLEFIVLKTLSSRTEFSILRLSIYILNLSLYILKLSFYILSLSIELLWWRK